jgi:hypothetical protein
MPTNLTFRPPASVLMGAPSMGVPQVGAAPVSVSGTMGDMQMGARPMPPHRKPRDSSCSSPYDDCDNEYNECENDSDNDCGDDCNQTDGFYNF